MLAHGWHTPTFNCPVSARTPHARSPRTIRAGDNISAERIKTSCTAETLIAVHMCAFQRCTILSRIRKTVTAKPTM